MTHLHSMRRDAPSAGTAGHVAGHVVGHVAGHVAGPGADQAFTLLRTVFTIAPIAFGLDKFFGLLTDWERYLAPWVNDLVPGTAHQAMLAVGVVEILAGVLVAVRPDVGALVVAAWLAGIILNLVTTGEYLDVALRDFGLLVAALALARLAQAARSSRRARSSDQAGDQSGDQAGGVR